MFKLQTSKSANPKGQRSMFKGQNQGPYIQMPVIWRSNKAEKAGHSNK